MEETKVTKYYISNWEKVKSIEVHAETKSVSILCEEIDSFFEHPLFDSEIEAVEFFVKWMQSYYERDSLKIQKDEVQLLELKRECFEELRKLLKYQEILVQLKSKNGG